MILSDGVYLIGQFFKFYFPVFFLCLFIYLVVIMFRRLINI